jgi:formylglycine-generating enzyme
MKHFLLILIFALMGICVLLPASSCKKDPTDENNPDTVRLANTVLVPAGTFTMGSPMSEESRFENEIQHQVTLSAFRMSKYEITNAQFAAFLNEKKIGSDGLYSAGTYSYQPLIYESSTAFNYDWGLHFIGTQWIPVAGYENHPVIEVTWFGASEFAAFVGGRLPTEAEWEYACRANTTTPFYTGDCLNNSQANYYWMFPYGNCINGNTTYPGSTQAVGTYEANDFGLYDMYGNVSEWCSDWMGEYPNTPQTNPTGATFNIYRVMRGGNWNQEARFCRSAFRGFYAPEFKHSIAGFRVAFSE